MNQISDILTLAQQAASQKVDAVLATVVHTEGSAYRRAGAMMLICADGRSVGMISGGCLEPHIIKRAFWLTRNGANVQVYQTGEDIEYKTESKQDNKTEDKEDVYTHPSVDDDIELNFGLGCNGRVQVLFERLDTAMPYLDQICHVRDTQQSARIATLISSQDAALQIGLRFNIDAFAKLVHQAGNKTGNKTGNNIDSKTDNKTISLTPNDNDGSAYATHLKLLSEYELANNTTAFVPITTLANATLAQSSLATAIGDLKTPLQCPTLQSQWLLQNLQPQKRLLICGAGNDVLPLVTLAKQQDWHVTVIDSRPQYAKPSRFITADKVICLPLTAEAELIALSRNAAVAVMSHSLTQDRARLKVLLQHPPLYLGQLGPRYRTERLLSEIISLSSNPEQLQAGIRQLHYPIGLKLGGEGPEALALGIMAQIAAVLHGKQVAIIEQSGLNNSNCDANCEGTKVNSGNKQNKGKNSLTVLTTETVL